MEQIFNKLRKANLVNSVKGPKGGYVLAKRSEDIKVTDIINAVEEKIRITRCKSDGVGCMQDGVMCLTHSLWEGLEKQIDAYFNAVTLSDICSKKKVKCNNNIAFQVE